MKQLSENGAGTVQNKRSDVLSRLGELQGALEAKFLEMGQLSENGVGMVQN